MPGCDGWGTVTANCAALMYYYSGWSIQKPDKLLLIQNTTLIQLQLVKNKSILVENTAGSNPLFSKFYTVFLIVGLK